MATYRKPSPYQSTDKYRGIDATLILADGFDATIFGVASLIGGVHAYRSGAKYRKSLTYRGIFGNLLAPDGFQPDAFGQPRVVYQARGVGFQTAIFGVPRIWNRTQVAGAIGFDAARYGTAWASYFLRNLTPTGIKQDVYGNATMSGGVRLAQMNGFATDAYGRPTVTWAIRQVYPTWFVATYYGTPMMGYDRTFQMAGFDATTWGDALVWDNTQHAYPPGMDATLFGTAWADRYVRSLGVKAFAEGDLENIGFPKLYNKRQYITNQYIAEQWIEGGIGDYQSMFVRNVNRKIDLVNNGIAPLFRQIPLTHEIVNGARVLHPPGLDATLWGVRSATGGTFIAPRIRSVYPQGFQPAELSTRFHIVRNAAFAPIPAGWDSSRLGVPPLVVNTRRSFYVGGLGRTDVHGLPFVAPRVRTIGPQNPLDPVRGIIGGATVWFRVRNITPTPPDFGWGAFGKAALDTHWNIVAAKSIPPSWQWGYGRVSNVTPEITPYWDSSLFTLFGNASIFNRYNPYSIEGWRSELWGPNTIITYRTKRPTPSGFDAFRGNPFHTVRNVNPDPPGQQYAADCTLGETLALGAVQFKNLALYPPGVFDSQFGQAKLQGMSLFPVGIPPFISDNGTQFGIPSVPGAQYANPKSIPDSSQDTFSGYFGTPRMTPWTIWAPAGAPLQARVNNPGSEEIVDSVYVGNNGVNTSSHPWFGLQRIELKNRRVTHYFSGQMDSYGQPRISRSPQYAVVDGMKFTKYGFPVLFGGNRAILHAGFDLSSYGQASLRIVEPFIRYLTASGQSMTLFGATWVANFIRYPGVTGLNATLFGQTWIHPPPPPAYPPGLDATLWGEAKPTDGMFVAYRIRELPVEGLDTFVCDYTLGSFRDRMRVKGRSIPRNVSLGNQAIMGTPALNAKDRSLNAATILPPVNQVPMPSTRRINRVNLVSLGQLTGWGEPWALGVTPGAVQPRGEDYSAVGMPRTSGQIVVDGWMGQLGAARVAQPVGASGLNTAQFGEMVLMGFGCGRQARAMIGFDGSTFGDVGIAQG